MDVKQDNPLNPWNKDSIVRDAKKCIEEAEKLLIDDSLLRDIDLKNKLKKIIIEIRSSAPEIFASSSPSTSSSSSGSTEPSDGSLGGYRYTVFNAIQVVREDNGNGRLHSPSPLGGK